MRQPVVPAGGRAVQADDGKPRITGDAAVFADLKALQRLTLLYTDFRGTLKVGPALRHLTTIGLPFSKFAPASPNRLETAFMVDGQLSGKVPQGLLTDDNMLQLMLRNNSLSSIDQDFRARTLNFIDLSHNDIVVRRPWAGHPGRGMPCGT